LYLDVLFPKEDGNIRNVLELDPAMGDLNVGTDYYYDALGRLMSISQGVQPGSFTYDDLGRSCTVSPVSTRELPSGPEGRRETAPVRWHAQRRVADRWKLSSNP